MGNDYDWNKKVYAATPRSPLPQELRSLASIISEVLGLGVMHPDALIINYYSEKGTLAPHVDRHVKNLNFFIFTLDRNGT